LKASLDCGVLDVQEYSSDPHAIAGECQPHKCNITDVSASAAEIEFNLTGCYGSPIHTNHNSNYSSMPSPDMDQSERKQQQHDQSRRPLSVATDNMMLEFYKKDGYDAKCCFSAAHSLSSHPCLFSGV
ncbi:hypothetical protein XENOCAPTIV_008461, partial [Xenoophorus captivus]